MGIEREVSMDCVEDTIETPNMEEREFDVDLVDTDIVDIEFVEYFETGNEAFKKFHDDDLPF